MNRTPHWRSWRRVRRGGILLGVALGAGLALLAQAKEVPFRTGILPLLTKAGCNAGACHGAATGQGGFKLSLLGYDPEEDFERITRERGGRRIDRAVPAESLLLRKGSGQIEHEGGRRWRSSSEAYQIVQQWIAAGAPFGARDLVVTNLRVDPDEAFRPSTNLTVDLRVEAALSDGTREDVTTLALYSSNDDAIAEVGKQGQVRMVGRGVTSIMVRYGGQVAAARLMVPFGKLDAAEAGQDGAHWIDRQTAEELQRLGLPRSPLSGEGEFLRRVYLDLIGRLPTLEEAQACLSAPRKDRDAIIAAVMQRPEFTEFWTMRLADLLLISGKRGSEASTRAYQDWLRGRLAENTPFDVLVRALLTGSGPMASSGPANFYALATDPRDLAEHAGRMFLGVQIACARCHAHPADRWTQEDYHRFAAYFARVTHEGGVVRTSARGEVDHPKTGEPLEPRPLGRRAASKAGGAVDRRLEVAEWMTSPNTTAFSRTFVNRVWKHLLGRGLVEPVDDLRPTNPATYPRLLDALAQDFVTHGHDLRRLIRTIVSTRTYQLTSRTVEANRLDDRYYAHAYVKELSAPVFLDAVAQVTGVPEVFAGYAEGTRAVQLVGARTPSYALDVLGRCSRDAACDGGARRGGGLAQALHLINGPTINAKLRGGIVAALQARDATSRQMIEELYLRAFTRRPEPAELAEWEGQFQSHADKKAVLEDLLWALLNSREFAFNH